jgi:predicted class III extradiol MEMO1 family dioxygenase
VHVQNDNDNENENDAQDVAQIEDLNDEELNEIAAQEMETKCGVQNNEHNLRPRHPRDYSNL